MLEKEMKRLRGKEMRESGKYLIKGFIEVNNLNLLINKILFNLNINERNFPRNSIDIIKKYYSDIEIFYEKFHTKDIGGIIYIGDITTSILLNSQRNNKSLNFDCMHELIHYWCHSKNNYLCVESNKMKSKKDLEWQANEGAAQALMPKDIFVQKYFEFDKDIKKSIQAIFLLFPILFLLLLLLKILSLLHNFL